MDLEIYSVVAAFIVIATLLTAVSALATYAVFQVRKRRGGGLVPCAAPAPQFFRRYDVTK